MGNESSNYIKEDSFDAVDNTSFKSKNQLDNSMSKQKIDKSIGNKYSSGDKHFSWHLNTLEGIKALNELDAIFFY